jgi:hypothetical protein
VKYKKWWTEGFETYDGAKGKALAEYMEKNLPKIREYCNEVKEYEEGLRVSALQKIVFLNMAQPGMAVLQNAPKWLRVRGVRGLRTLDVGTLTPFEEAQHVVGPTLMYGVSYWGSDEIACLKQRLVYNRCTVFELRYKERAIEENWETWLKTERVPADLFILS